MAAKKMSIVSSDRMNSKAGVNTSGHVWVVREAVGKLKGPAKLPELHNALQMLEKSEDQMPFVFARVFPDVSGRADMRRVCSWIEGQLAMLRQQWVFHPTSHATRILLMDTHRARSHQSNKLSYQMVLRSKECQHMYKHDDDR